MNGRSKSTFQYDRLTEAGIHSRMKAKKTIFQRKYELLITVLRLGAHDAEHDRY